MDVIFERAERRDEVKSLLRGGLFLGYRDDIKLQHDVCDLTAAFERLDRNRELEVAATENLLTLHTLEPHAWRDYSVLRATYANEVADRVFRMLPEERDSFALIAAFYAILKRNLHVLFFWKRFFLTIALASLVFTPMLAAELTSWKIWVVYAVVATIFVALNFILLEIYGEGMKASRNILEGQLSNRTLHLESCEQAALSGVISDETDALNDSEWQQRSLQRAYAARAYRWRIFFIKQFLDVACHKMFRRHIWVNKFGPGAYWSVFAIIAFVLAGVCLFISGASIDSAISFVEKRLPIYAVSLLLAIGAAIASFKVWDADVERLVNAIGKASQFRRQPQIESIEEVVQKLVGRVRREREARQNST